jgi:RimJ/RimL family protein N-acetyltransferase
MEEQIREHNVILSDGQLTLRPMTENDWDLLFKWDNDPEVLYYSEGGNVTSNEIEVLHIIYRGVSREAFNFIIEFDDRPIGWCWLQKMNLDRILSLFPGKDIRRIDMAIGEKDLWGKGIGTRMIGMLTRFAFKQENADAVFGCSVADYNLRSKRTFERNGYKVFHQVPEPEGSKAEFIWDLIITRHEYMSSLVAG